MIESIASRALLLESTFDSSDNLPVDSHLPGVDLFLLAQPLVNRTFRLLGTANQSFRPRLATPIGHLLVNHAPIIQLADEEKRGAIAEPRRGDQ